MTQFFAQCTERNNWVILTLKVEALAELKFNPSFYRSKWLNFSLSAPIEKIESFWPKKLSLAKLKFDPTFLVKNDSIFCELSHFHLKSWVTGGIINRPAKVSNWRIFESIELSKLSQFHSQCWFNLTLNVEPIWLSMLSQLDTQRWVN